MYAINVNKTMPGGIESALCHALTLPYWQKMLRDYWNILSLFRAGTGWFQPCCNLQHISYPPCSPAELGALQWSSEHSSEGFPPCLPSALHGKCQLLLYALLLLHLSSIHAKGPAQCVSRVQTVVGYQRSHYFLGNISDCKERFNTIVKLIYK